MAKKLNSALGIDIGSRKIKIAEIRAQGREPVVTAIGMIDTPEGAVDHTGVYNADAVGAALKQLVGETGASVGQCIVSIQGQSSVLVRTLEVPRMNSNELKDHMEWEMNRNNPFAEANPIRDFKPLADTTPNSTNMDVVMAIASPSAVDTIIQCIKKAGKQTAAIDVEPLGLARSLMHSHDEDYRGQTVCVVNIGHKTTSINIYNDGKLLMPRQVPVGGEMFTKAISDHFGISTDEAESKKCNEADISSLSVATPSFSNPFGGDDGMQAYNPFSDETVSMPANPFADAPAPVEDAAPFNPYAESPEPAPIAQDSAPLAPAGNEVNTALSNELDEFVAEIRRSIDYFRGRGGDVNRIVLCGGGAKLRGIDEFLNKALGIQCDVYDPLSRLNVNAKKADNAFIDAHRQEFALAVGNGLHILF
ncbi:MAG: type IV pilus assembly protein PilM [Fimbriimonadaceae bacterium]